jgi:hypothetical protein
MKRFAFALVAALALAFAIVVTVRAIARAEDDWKEGARFIQYCRDYVNWVEARTARD